MKKNITDVIKEWSLLYSFLYLMHFCINIYFFIFSSEAIVLLFSKNNLLMHSLLFSKHDCSSFR